MSESQLTQDEIVWNAPNAVPRKRKERDASFWVDVSEELAKREKVLCESPSFVPPPPPSPLEHKSPSPPAIPLAQPAPPVFHSPPPIHRERLAVPLIEENNACEKLVEDLITCLPLSKDEFSSNIKERTAQFLDDADDEAIEKCKDVCDKLMEFARTFYKHSRESI
jgi:hypothetical protein